MKPRPRSALRIDRFMAMRKALKVVPSAGPKAAAVDEKAALTALQHCELCGGERRHGRLLVTIPGRPSIWVCDDCQKMLLLRVDDKGTPGD
jgi:hypothetical protein